MQALVPGGWQRENSIEENNNNADEGLGDTTPGRAPCGSSSQPRQANDDDASSVASGIMVSLSPMLSLSPIPYDGKGRASYSKQRSNRQEPKYEFLPPYIVDAQLVTKKTGKECQRVLLLRMYRGQDVARATDMGGEYETAEEAYDVVAPLGGASGTGSLDQALNDVDDDVDEWNSQDIEGSGKAAVRSAPHIDPLLESKRSLSALMEASALVQRIKAVGGSGFAIHPQRDPHEGDAASSVNSHSSTKSYLKSLGSVLTSPIRYLSSATAAPDAGTTPPIHNPGSRSVSLRQPTVAERMAHALLHKCVPSPSVGTQSKEALAAAKRKSRGIFPALSAKDAPYVKSSWMFLRDCIEELDRRCLAHSTLGIRPLFKFPALPTLDAHFIAQINVFCRETMIASLVKTASELELYAREEEVSCSNLEQLLRPTFELYEMAPPQLPMPVPLTSYPLDFRAPEGWY